MRAAAIVCSILCLTAAPRAPRLLTFEQRVEAQRAIERVYYTHQIGARRPFDAVVTREVLERKVRSYLAESAALERLWDTPITAAMLRAETERIARSTRLPDRLREMYAALGDDTFVFEETFARATLADRLARSFFAADERFTLADGTRTAWDVWWARARRDFEDIEVADVADEDVSFSIAAASSLTCGPSDVWDNDILDDVPDPRPGATAVWTGTQMIVWGGGDFEEINIRPAGSYDTGGRYDPLTDTWSPTSTRNAPAPRIHHTAVWTGSEMIVWGGYDDRYFRFFGDGGRYDPVTDTWSALPASGAPEARLDHTAVWTGTEMVVWGGSTRNSPYVTDTGGRYDPETNLWTPTSTSNAPAARYQHMTVWTGSSMVVWGGLSASGYFSSGARYDPATDAWTPIANAPATGYDEPVVWTGSEMIVWGVPVLNGALRYSPSNDTWRSASTAGAPSFTRPTAVWTGSEMIVWGDCGSTSCAAGRYNPASDSWSASTSSNAPKRREGHVAVWTGNLMIVWGGYDLTQYRVPTSTGGRYDPVANVWTPTSTGGSPTPRNAPSSVWTGSLVIVWSGGTGGRYDPLAGTWSPTSTLGAPGGGSADRAVWSGERMIVWGEGTRTGGRYDPVADVWAPTSTVGAPVARYNYTTVWTGSEMIVWGGTDQTTPWLNTGGRYDPVADVWTSTATTGAPAARQNHTAVWTGGEMIVWGGDAGSGIYLDSGSRYDPATDTWTPIAMLDAPAGRHFHSAVWTGSEMIVWGGALPASPWYTNTGGRYDPAADRWTPTAFGPPARHHHTAVWTGREMIVWGGDTSFAFPVSQGDRYDPSTNLWSPTTDVAAPSPRSSHTAVWTGEAMLVWGGSDQFAWFSSGGRYLPGPAPDGDGDGVRACEGDCNDADPQNWGTPGEVGDLTFAGDGQTVGWAPPASPGGASPAYDTLRSAVPSDFPGSAVCLETADGADTMAIDAAVPSAGSAFLYLVRAVNGCPGTQGIGSLGTDSSGAARVARTCP